MMAEPLFDSSITSHVVVVCLVVYPPDRIVLVLCCFDLVLSFLDMLLDRLETCIKMSLCCKEMLCYSNKRPSKVEVDTVVNE